MDASVSIEKSTSCNESESKFRDLVKIVDALENIEQSNSLFILHCMPHPVDATVRVAYIEFCLSYFTEIRGKKPWW